MADWFHTLGTPELLALAGALGWASGFRLYAVVFIVGLACDAAAQGLGVALVRLQLARPWLANGTLARLSEREVASPHAHYLCWRAGTMDRWECTAFAQWLQESLRDAATTKPGQV